MRGVVITGGETPSETVVAHWAASSEFVVAADSGLTCAIRNGIQPDLVVGDFDSLDDPGLLDGIDPSRVRRYPRAKDETDTEIAVRICRESGVDEVVILGGGGGQMAHFVGILSLFDRPDAPAVWVTDSTEFTCISTSLTISGRVGDVIGFFPLGCDICEMYSTGLRWPLDAVVWKKGDIGVSNESSSTRAEVGMKRGRLLMVRDLQG